MQDKILSWKEFSDLSERLFEKIPRDSLDRILCVGSGGLIIGRLAADYFEKELAVIMAKRYKRGVHSSANKVCLGDISSINPLEGRILLVDDLIEDGLTSAKIHNYVRKIKGVEKIETAVLFIKPGAKFKADYYVEETNKWIVFPYEKKEFGK